MRLASYRFGMVPSMTASAILRRVCPSPAGRFQFGEVLYRPFRLRRTIVESIQRRT